MLLVSPVTWDFSLPLLLVPFVVVAASANRLRSPWMAVALLVILTIDWIPQNILTELMQAGRSFSAFPWTFMLGAPSLKFYALLGTFVVSLACFRAENQENMRKDQLADPITDSLTRSRPAAVAQSG
jgi:hypothetical protein